MTFIPLYVIIICQYLIIFLGKNVFKDINTIYIIVNMGWTLTSRETKNCGCVEETHVHDDFPTSDTSLVLCKECETKKVEEEKKGKKKKPTYTIRLFRQ